jgi:hypothetical protein
MLDLNYDLVHLGRRVASPEVQSPPAGEVISYYVGSQIFGSVQTIHLNSRGWLILDSRVVDGRFLHRRSYRIGCR